MVANDPTFGTRYYFLGIWHYPSTNPSIISQPVASTWENEALAFGTSYAAKSLAWLKGVLR